MSDGETGDNRGAGGGSNTGERTIEQIRRKRVNQRAGHRGFVTKILVRVIEDAEKEDTEDVRQQLQGYKMTLIEKLDVLQRFDDEIVEDFSDAEDLVQEIENASDIRNKMHAAISRIDSALLRNTGRFSTPDTPERSKSKTAKLPKLKLQSFSGNPLEFPSFWDSFTAAVHGDPSIEKIMKFNYLRSYLQGQALSAINGLSLTAANYDEAVNILNDRFGNKQLLISSNMEKLLSIPAVYTVENIEKIRDMYNKIETCIRNLRSLNVRKQQYGPVLISIVMAKLPEEIRLVISRCMPTNEEWSTESFLEILKKEVESREICSHMKGKKKNGGPPVVKMKPDVEDGDGEDFTGSTLLNTFERKISCTYCRRNHVSSKCDVITDVRARKAILRRKARCFVCLRSGHMARQCSSTMKCFKCQQRHHISICEESKHRDGEHKDQYSKDSYHKYEKPPISVTNSVAISKKHTFLQTARAKIVTINGKCEEVRVLFDSCSQRSFINRDVAQKLNLPIVKKERMIVKAFETENEKPRLIDTLLRAKFAWV